MNENQFKRLEESVTKAMYGAAEPAIKTYVNGKIDKINTKLDEHIQQHKEDIEGVHESIKTIETMVQPIAKTFGWWKMTGIYLIALLSILASISQVLSLFINKL